MSGKKLYVEITGNITGLVAALSAGAAEVQAFGHRVGSAAGDVERLAASSTRMRNALSAVALVTGGAFAAGLILSGRAAVDLESKLENVATISSDVANNLGEYEQLILDMSTRLPQSAGELADGLYDIVSSGFDAQDALTVLDASAQAASAGLSDTATSARAITAVLNAYGLSASDAGDVSDILFETVNKGVVTFSELASVVGSFVSTAAAAKVPFDDAASALAAMTLSGQDASEAATSLNQLFTQLLRPGTDLANVIHDIGYESGAQMLRVLGLRGTIQALAQSQGTAADTANQLFTNIRAARGFMALTAAQGRNYASTFDAIANDVNRAEAAHKALEHQQKSTAYQMGILRNTAAKFGTELGLAILPVLKLVVGGLTDFMRILDMMPAPVRDIVAVLGIAATAVLLFGGAFLKFKPQVDMFRASLVSLREEGSLLPSALNVAGLAAAGLGAVLAGATLIYAHYAAAKAHAKQLTDEFTQALEQEKGAAKDAANQTAIKELVSQGDVNTLNEFGVSVGKVIGDLTSGGPAIDQTISRLETLQLHLQQGAILAHAAGDVGTYVTDSRNADALGSLISHLKTVHDSYLAGADAARQNRQANEDLATATARQTGRLSELSYNLDRNKQGTIQLTDAQKALQSTLDGMVNPANAVKTAMNGASQSLDDFMSKLQKQLHDQRTYADNLGKLAAMGRYDLVSEFEKMGPQAAGLVAQAVHATKGQLDHLSGIFAREGRLDTQTFDIELQELAAIGGKNAAAAVKAIAKNFAGGDMDAAVNRIKELKQDIDNLPPHVQKVIDVIIRQYDETHAVTIPVTERLGVSTDNLKRIVKADGGYISGLGGPRDDMIPAMLSNGEYVMPAAQTTKHFAVLEAMRANAFRDGGMVVGKALRLAKGGVVNPGKSVLSSLAAIGIGDGSSDEIQKAIDAVGKLADAWQRTIQQMQDADQHRQLTKQLSDAQEKLRKAQRETGKSAEADVRSATQSVHEAKKALADFEEQRRQAAVSRKLDAAQAKLEREEQRAQDREARAQQRADAQERLKENEQGFLFDKMSTAEQIAYLGQKLAAEKRYSDQWMQDYQQQQELLQQQQQNENDLASKINDLLTQRDSIVASEAQAQATYAASIAQATTSYQKQIDQILQSRKTEIMSFSLDDVTGALWNTDQTAANRTLTDLGLLTDAMQAYGDQTTNITATTAGIEQQTEAIDKWAAGLAQLRSRGLSEDAISLLGLDTSPAKLAQVQAFANATDQQIADLNNSVTAEMTAASREVSTEQQGMFGDMADQLQSAQQEFNDSVAQAWDTLQNELVSDQQQLNVLGQDTGLSIAQAIAQGLASGIPGIIAIAQQLAAAIGSGVTGSIMPVNGTGLVGSVPGMFQPAALFDSGGVWPSGTVGMNRSGSPEYVFTTPQLRSLVGAGGGGRTVIVENHLTVDARGAQEGVADQIQAAFDDFAQQVSAGVGRNA